MKFINVLIVFTLFCLNSCQQKNNGNDSVSCDVISCDAEKILSDSSAFITNGNLGIAMFSNAKNRTSEFAHSGKYSIKLGKDDLYGFTTKEISVAKNATIEVSVWRRKGNKDAQIVVSAQKVEDFYINSATVVDADKDWEKIVCRIKVPAKLENRTVTCYVWNPNAKLVAYFDDIEIKFISK